jgi:SAM-dependent methyltransferase
VPDPLFADPRLAWLYDQFEDQRDDLDHYIAIARELDARTVLDVGCGTGCLALRLADEGLEVTGVDPAMASLDVARTKPGAERVRWVHGTASDAPVLGADLALMTGNVAQVFLDDQTWAAALRDISQAMRTGGHLVFETRRPAYRAWEEWGTHPAKETVSTPVGLVTRRFTITEIDLPLVSFRYSYNLPDGAHLTSDSTIRFRTRDEIEASLAHADFATLEVRQAPDRPDREYVFIAGKPTDPTSPRLRRSEWAEPAIPVR